MVVSILLLLLFLPFLILGGGIALAWKKQRRRVLRWTGIGYLIVALFSLLGVGPFWLARFMSRAGSRAPDLKLKDTPADSGVPYENIQFQARDGIVLSGWFIPPSRHNVIVVLSHGLFRTRVEMLSRAVGLAKAGFGVLLYDSRNHGTSGKATVSLGYYEAQDILGAIDVVRQRLQIPTHRPQLVLMGVSMGAVATLQAAAQTRDYSALVLDSPFSSVRQTVIDHAWLFFRMPRFVFPPLFIFWFQKFAGIDVDWVNSHESLQRIQPVPLLMIASEGDQRMSPQITRDLFNEAKSPVKHIHVFGKDVGHGAAARLHPQEYLDILVGFLNNSLALD